MMDTDGDHKVNATEWIKYMSEVKRLKGIAFLDFLYQYLRRIMEQRKWDKIHLAPEAHPSRFVLKKFAYAATEYTMIDILYRGRFTDVFKVAGLVTRREKALKVTDGDGQGYREPSIL